MAVKIIGVIIGILILCAGLSYFIKEKHDPESRKIYTVASVVGGAICIASAIWIVL